MIEFTVLMSDTASAPPRFVADIGRQLHDHRHAAVLLAPARDHLDIFRDLADGGAHAALRHAVRTAEIQFDAVGLGVLDRLEDGLPAILGARHHQGDDDGAIGPVALHLLDLAQIDVERAVGDEFDIVEANHPHAADFEGAIARRGVHDRRVFAQGLPHDAAPARLEGAHDVVFLVGRRRGRQPERIGGTDADEIRPQIGHGMLLRLRAGDDRWRWRRPCRPERR
jgi:hypothetical protein